MSESSGEGENSYPQGNVPQDKNWEWIACVYDMKRSTPESEITWNLSPSIMLTLPSEQNVQPKVDLIIESSKQFIYSEGLGWNWHKSWNIPDIHCTLDIRDPLTNEKLLPPSKIYAEIYVVRAVINQIHTFHLVDVGIKGGNRSEFDSSRCVFTGLKFDTTSYNHEGSKFHLVIVVYLNQNKFEHPKILESRISPPIFVDSRKSARDTQNQKAQKLSSFIDPFLPENMDKKFIKRESKRKYNADEPIDNNIEGLSNYFSAPNIRHKVKHPLFLAIKFSSCVKIYFNVNIIPYNNNNEKFVEVMQKQLMEAYNRSSTNTNINIDDKPLILTIEHTLSQQTFKQKKINEFLEPLHGDVLHVMIDPVNIPKNFRKLEDIEGVKDAYRKVYPKISQQKFGQGGDDDDSGPPVKKGSKVKVEKDNKKNYQSDDSDDEVQGANPSKKMKGNDVQSVIDSQKLQIKNPAQQSEIILNQSAQNQQQMKSMIMEGAKPQKEKQPKGAEKAQANKPEETTKPAKGGRGKKGAKNQAPANANEPAQIPSSQNIPSLSQLPQMTTQFSQQNSNVSTIPPIQNIGASGSQQPSNNTSQQWSQQQPNPGMQKPPLNNSQSMYPGGDLTQQNLNKGVSNTFPQQNQKGFQQQNPYGAQQQNINGPSQIEGNNNFGMDSQKRQSYGQQPYGQPGQGIPGGQQQLNNIGPGQQRPMNLSGSQQGNQGYYPPQMGTNPQVPGQQTGQVPSQQPIQNQPYQSGSGHNIPGQVQQPVVGQNQFNQMTKPLNNPNSSVKEGFEDPNLIQNRNAGSIQSGQFKPPITGGSNPHLNQSQHQYGGNPPVVQAPQGHEPDASADTADPTKQQYPQVNSQQQYNMGQNQLQGQHGQFGNQYNPQQQQYQQYQRNNSQQLFQQQQQGRVKPIQMNQQGQMAGANQQGGQFYDQQSGNQFMQNGTDVNQYGSNNGYNPNSQGLQQYQMNNMGGQNQNYYDEDDQLNQQSQYNRYTSNSQGQFQLQGQNGQNSQYNNYQNQYQNNQNMNNQQYGYNQQQYNNFQQNDQQMYLKQNMNPQFQYYQQQQPNQQDMMNNQGMGQNGQMRAQSNSIPHQQYYVPKEEEYGKNNF